MESININYWDKINEIPIPNENPTLPFPKSILIITPIRHDAEDNFKMHRPTINTAIQIARQKCCVTNKQLQVQDHADAKSSKQKIIFHYEHYFDKGKVESGNGDDEEHMDQRPL